MSIKLRGAQVLLLEEALNRYEYNTSPVGYSGRRLPKNIAMEDLVEDILNIVLPKEPICQSTLKTPNVQPSVRD